MTGETLAAARAAGLRYVDDRQPGLRRLRRGRGFVYVDQSGRRIGDADVLARIRKLAIPPAYTDVWICANPNGHVQATGRDARRRKQYRYHAEWRTVRDAAKFEHVIEFARALPAIRARVDADLSLGGLPRDKVLASVVRLLESTRARVGNVEYARTNGSYGLTTLRNRHVEIDRATLRFRFRGKSGVEHVVSIADRRLARVIERCRDLPGQELFAYVDDEGAVVPIHSDDVNEYLRGVSGADVTAKDFRTWSATTLCAVVLEALPPARTERHRKEAIVRTIAQVAAQLGNTAAVCRKCYVHPALIEAFLDDGYIRLPRRRGARGASNGLEAVEERIARFLEAAAVAAEKRRNRGRRTERVADEHSVQSQRHVDRRARRKRPLVGRNPRPSTRASARARRPRR
jgi:DNA topoisomerase-1